MAPSHSRHLLVWTTLPIAVLLSYLWFKRKRVEARSDPGRIEPTDQVEKSLDQELREAEASDKPVSSSSPKTFSRSLSGVDSAPIDIIFPPELKSAKSSQIIISDEDLDLEIEKIKSMKNSVEFYSKRKDAAKSNSQPKSPAPQKPNLKITGNTPKKESNQRITLQKASPRKTGSVRKEDKSSRKAENKTPIKSPSANNNNNNSINNNNSRRTNNNSANNKTEMAQKDVVTVGSIEKKISSLKIDTKEACSPQEKKTEVTTSAAANEHDIQRQSSERDSANHSPADVMLASPSLSSISDSHSEGSSDSGKGCSEVATPPSRTPAGDGSISGDVVLPIIYQFIIPQNLVGKLIGKYGSSILQIKTKSHAQILIKKHPETNSLKICAIEGTQAEIDHALELIRNKFPLKRYPELTLEQVSFLHPVTTVPLISQHVCIRLVEGINNDTIVSCMVAPNHLFLQQPTHPTFPNLNILSGFMNACYADANSPMLPNPMPENPICAAYSLGAWYRALVLSPDNDTETSYVKFLDYGGYANIKNSDLRQIRADFLLLPFQASECYLSNIRPKGGEEVEWSEDAFKLVADLTRGSIIYTQIVNYTEDEIPLVLIYVVLPPQRVVFLNGELVNRGYAEWIVDETENTEGAVGGVVANA
ncbi:hypothetical protein ILUMI_09295 [Ignelater luminosus]|uniref:Tudor domain-containing protein n=1 Tax=Ignelater luminosus TaxID=2038154 RepID=A0A8K0D026_IGNLU|nr:hypothetical protein ILUMI_09295 [Ignelater luminosus]